jgi:hypothetical protein
MLFAAIVYVQRIAGTVRLARLLASQKSKKTRELKRRGSVLPLLLDAAKLCQICCTVSLCLDIGGHKEMSSILADQWRPRII